jgi:hypothetical protein
VGLVVGVDELADARPVADHDVVGEDHRERLVADQVLGHEHGVPEPELLLLADVRHLGEVADVADLPEHLDVALLLEQGSSSYDRSKWSSIARFWLEVTMMTCSMPAATASSTAYWMIGLSTSGSISFGCALVAGRKRVPQPAAGRQLSDAQSNLKACEGADQRSIPTAPAPPSGADRSGPRPALRWPSLSRP